MYLCLADKDTATECPEWASLTVALQDVLARGWTSKQHQAHNCNHLSSSRANEGLEAVCYTHLGAGYQPGDLVLPARQCNASGGISSVMVHCDSVFRGVVAVPQSCVAGVVDAVKSFATVLNGIL